MPDFISNIGSELSDRLASARAIITLGLYVMTGNDRTCSETGRRAFSSPNPYSL